MHPMTEVTVEIPEHVQNMLQSRGMRIIYTTTAETEARRLGCDREGIMPRVEAEPGGFRGHTVVCTEFAPPCEAACFF